MDRDTYKRKPRSGENNDCRRNKEPKLMESPKPTTSTNSTGNKETPRNPDFTQALVAMWFGGTPGEPFMAQEVREGIALKDCQEKCLETENMVHALRNQVSKAHALINDMKKSLKTEETTNAEMISELNHTRDLAATIKDMVNYITANLQRSKQHKNRLSDLYNDVILTQRRKYVELQAREKSLQDEIDHLQSKISNLEQNLQASRTIQEDNSNEIRKSFEADLTELRNDFVKADQELKIVCAEKNNIQSKLEVVESRNIELEKSTDKYENTMKTLDEQLTKTLAARKIIEEENTRLKNEINDKNSEITANAADLRSALTKQDEQSAEIMTIQKENKSLGEKIKNEIKQRESLAQSFEAMNERCQELAMQVESLKRKREEALKEMQEKIENAEKGTRDIASEAKRENENLKTKHELLVKSLTEKYESSVNEMKLLKSRHQNELSEARKSTDSALRNSSTEKCLLEDAVDALTREKTNLQVDMKQIEDLLMKHLDSENQLRAKLDDQMTTVQADKKRSDDDAQKYITKIQELEKKLLNLEVNRNASTIIENSNYSAVDKPDPKVKESVKKTVRSTYEKSSLKRAPNRRKTRSSPPSPVSVVQPMLAKKDNKNIKFNFDSSSDASPVKLVRTPVLTTNFMDDDFFDDLLGKSSSQPLQSSQTLKFQKQPTQRKFFKSRPSQSK